MIPMEPVSTQERRVVKLMRSLRPEDRATLLRFAQFLAAGGGAAKVQAADERPAAAAAPEPDLEPTPAPIPEPRPADETVVAAIKRLRRVYPMLDPGAMLHETSALMAAHVLQGRDASAVIDELERLFAIQYETWSKSDEDAKIDDGSR